MFCYCIVIVLLDIVYFRAGYMSVHTVRFSEHLKMSEIEYSGKLNQINALS